MPYLWASAAVSVSPWRLALAPTALSLLADTVSAHLAARERFTVYFDWRYSVTWSQQRKQCARRAHEAAEVLRHAIETRNPAREMTVETICYSSCSLVRFVPTDEWHPEPGAAPGPPQSVLCDASYKKQPHESRAGLSLDNREIVAIDLLQAAPRDSSQAEFLAVCLALLTGADARGPLTVYSDEKGAVHDARLLHRGQMPAWLYWHGNDLAVRIAVAAMTAVRLRQVTIEWRPRAFVGQAHRAASLSKPDGSPWAPRKWAARQGVPLSWHDRQRGLDHDGYERPPFVCRRPDEGDPIMRATAASTSA
ncbi:ribonuclease H family protein [Paenibacillus lactis]|uniref:hypothetical protein n=1 Tax=Paenibacillus lactis TaxID=228574 RepID=UPI003678BA0F